MKLSDLAKLAGVQIVAVGPGWGGKWGYKDAKYPHSTVCGFKTKAEAIDAWAEEMFGPVLMPEIVKLLNNQKESSNG